MNATASQKEGGRVSYRSEKRDEVALLLRRQLGITEGVADKIVDLIVQAAKEEVYNRNLDNEGSERRVQEAVDDRTGT